MRFKSVSISFESFKKSRVVLKKNASTKIRKKKKNNKGKRNNAITKRYSVGTLVTLKAMNYYQNSGQGSRQKIQLLTN